MSAEPQATVAEQEYLETIFWLYEAGLPMTGANSNTFFSFAAPLDSFVLLFAPVIGSPAS